MRRLREFLTGYIERRTKSGAFREVDPVLAARAFIGMLTDHLIVREVFGQRAEYPQTNAEVAETFVSIFLRRRAPREPASGRDHQTAARTAEVQVIMAEATVQDLETEEPCAGAPRASRASCSCSRCSAGRRLRRLRATRDLGQPDRPTTRSSRATSSSSRRA